MRTLLEVKHFSKERKLLPDSYKGWSRSFTKHFIECLYLPHANILTGAPYSLTDVLGSTTRLVDADSNTPANYLFSKANMQLVGPGGYGMVNLPMGDTYSNSSGSYQPGTGVPGHVIGIQIGRSNTAVTPTDTALNDKIHHGTRAAVGASNIDSVTAGDNADQNNQTTNGYIGMIYRPLRSCSMADIQFKCFRSGNPGNVNAIVVGICNKDTSNLAADATIIATSNAVNANAWGAASPGALITFTFASPPYLQAGFTYFIAITRSQASGGNYVNIRTHSAANLSRLSFVYASLLGIANNVQAPYGNGIVMFQIDGTAGSEMEYGATDLYGYTVSNPTALFTLRRIFMNNSGLAITVQESGIYLPVTRYVLNLNAYDYNNFIVCAAHDVFAGITVNNGESLEIDYTPSIHV